MTFLLLARLAAAQVNTGELRLKVIDPAGLGVKASVQVSSQASQYSNSLSTDGGGNLDLRRLPYGVYAVAAQGQGLKSPAKTIEVRSALPVDSTSMTPRP